MQKRTYWRSCRASLRDKLSDALMRYLRIRAAIAAARAERDYCTVGILERDLRAQDLKVAAANAGVAISEYHLMHCDPAFSAECRSVFS